MEEIIEKLMIPKVIIKYIMINFLDLDSIKKTILVSKKFNIFNEYDKKFMNHANLGINYCCENGYLDEAKWLYNNHKININIKKNKKTASTKKKITCDEINNETFNISCYNGHLEVAKWLYSLFSYESIFIYDLSYIVCEKGKIDIAKWIYYLKKRKMKKWLNDLFYVSCSKGHYDLSKWLYSLGIEKISHKDSLFIDACRSGNIDLVKWLNEILEIKKYDYVFAIVCIDSHLEIAKFIHSLESQVDNKDFNDIFTSSFGGDNFNTSEWLYSLYSDKLDLYKIIGEMCDTKGDKYIDTIKWIYSLNPKGIDISINNNYLFRYNCGQKHNINICQWLYSLGCVNIHDNDDEAFILACNNLDLKLAKWLYSLGGVNIHIKNNYPLRNACKYQNLKFAKWLYSLGGIDIHIQNDYLFRHACKEGNIEIAKWLYSLGNVNVNSCDDYALTKSCKNRHLKVAKWLYSLNKFDIHRDNDYLYRKTFKWGSSCSKITEWILSLGNIDIDYINKNYVGYTGTYRFLGGYNIENENMDLFGDEYGNEYENNDF